MTDQLNGRARRALGKKVRAELEKLGKPRKWLVGESKCSEKTIRNVIEGVRTSGKTLGAVCRPLGIDPNDLKSVEVSDENHGGYTLENVADYIGHFHAYRWNFSNPTQIVRSTFDITWDKSAHCLRFDEHHCYDCSNSELDAQKDYSQNGQIFLSNTINLLQFVTMYRGAIRIITVFKPRLNNPNDWVMRGAVLTQAKLDVGYQPSASPIVLEKTQEANFAQDLKKTVVILNPGDPEYDRIHRELVEVERDCIKFARSPEQGAILGSLAKNPRAA